MKSQVLIWIPCLIGIVTCLAVENRHDHHDRSHHESPIDKSARIGKHTWIAKDVIIKADAKIGDFVKIYWNTVIGKESKVGRYSRIGQSVTLDKKVTIDEFTKVGDRSMIGSESMIKNYCRISDDVIIGSRMKMNDYARAGRASDLGDDSMMGKYATTGSMTKLEPKSYVGVHSYVDDKAIIGKSAFVDDYTRIGFAANVQPNAYIGKFSKIGSLVTVGKLAVVHNMVRIPFGRMVENGEVVIQTPSSLDLYRMCADTVSDEQAATATPKEDGTISPEFNTLMRQLMEEEMKALTTNCGGDGGDGGSEMKESMRPKTLPQILSLYLIQYHGLDSFKDYTRQITRAFELNDLELKSKKLPLKQKLANEFHFGENSEKSVLESDVRKTLVQLLTIDQDAERIYRAKDDTFCKMFEQLRNGERMLTLSERDD